VDTSTIVIVAVVIIILAICLIVALRKKRNNSNVYATDSEESALVRAESLSLDSNKLSELLKPIEWLSTTETIEEKSLFKITDNTVIARISETIPGALDLVAKTASSKALKGVELYKAVIPSGATLAASRQVEGAYRGIYRGAKGIQGHANLVKVDPTKITKASSIASGAANVMNVASLIVGQYYMSVIDSKLEDLSKSVSQISDFQKREFKSRILALIAQTGKISTFSTEILENDDLRRQKTHSLDNLEMEGTKLLQQVNLSIDEIVNSNQKPDYDEYQEMVDELGVLVEHQHILLSLLEEISKLTYLLGKGEASGAMCFSIYNTYSEQSDQIRGALVGWHNKQVELLHIDIEKDRMSRTGIGGVVSTLPGLIDEKWKYKRLKSDLGRKIDAQKNQGQLLLDSPQEIYEKDVQIIIKDGNYYYLHEIG